MGVDGLQPSDYPVHIRQGGTRAIASDHSIVSFSDGQVDVAHADLREIWEVREEREVKCQRMGHRGALPPGASGLAPWQLECNLLELV